MDDDYGLPETFGHHLSQWFAEARTQFRKEFPNLPDAVVEKLATERVNYQIWHYKFYEIYEKYRKLQRDYKQNTYDGQNGGGSQ